jgi:ribosomal RNA-processing protein 17
MAVDHGLGGKDTAKSKERRVRKAKKVSAIAKSALTKKKEVIFNEESRAEYLTGFRKRKQERRKYGYAMQILHDKNERRERKKEMRQAFQNITEESRKKSKQGLGLDSEEGGDEDDSNADSGAVDRAVDTFEDELTQQMFGGAVSVVVDSGVADVMDRTFDENMGRGGETASVGKRPVNKGPTKLERALAKAAIKMNASKSKKQFKKASGTKLLHKAMGSGMLGSNSFKGKKAKGKR